MLIRCHRTTDALHALAPHWNALLQRSRSDSIFLTWEWISTWWEVFGHRFDLLVLTAEDADGRLLGIAPTMVGRRRTASRLTFRALMIVGQRGDTLAEYLDFIVEPGHEREVTAAFSGFFRRELAAEWDFMAFERILTTSPNLPTLEATMHRPRFVAARDARLKSPHVTLAESWPALLASKSRNFRAQWNNSWNRLHAEGRVEFLFGGTDMPLETALAEVTRLHRERWREKSASFKTDEYLAFHERLCARLHANGWLLLLLLAVDGKNVAVRYDYVYAGKLWCMQGGWSPEWAAKRVGTLLTGKVIEWGIAHGLAEYDFLGGDSEYKRRWATGERVMTNLTACNTATLRGRAWKWNRALEDAARHVRRRLGRDAPAPVDEPLPQASLAAAALPPRMLGAEPSPVSARGGA
jgi:CelD/BcsL family acetyltransferase involved in cellulose biosynthesis